MRIKAFHSDQKQKAGDNAKENCVENISAPLNQIHLNNPLSPEYRLLTAHFL